MAGMAWSFDRMLSECTFALALEADVSLRPWLVTTLQELGIDHGDEHVLTALESCLLCQPGVQQSDAGRVTATDELRAHAWRVPIAELSSIDGLARQVMLEVARGREAGISLAALRQRLDRGHGGEHTGYKSDMNALGHSLERTGLVTRCSSSGKHVILKLPMFLASLRMPHELDNARPDTHTRTHTQELRRAAALLRQMPGGCMALEDLAVPLGWDRQVRNMAAASARVADDLFVCVSRAHTELCGKLAFMPNVAAARMSSGGSDPALIDMKTENSFAGFRFGDPYPRVAVVPVSDPDTCAGRLPRAKAASGSTEQQDGGAGEDAESDGAAEGAAVGEAAEAATSTAQDESATVMSQLDRELVSSVRTDGSEASIVYAAELQSIKAVALRQQRFPVVLQLAQPEASVTTVQRLVPESLLHVTIRAGSTALSIQSLLTTPQGAAICHAAYMQAVEDAVLCSPRDGCFMHALLSRLGALSLPRVAEAAPAELMAGQDPLPRFRNAARAPLLHAPVTSLELSVLAQAQRCVALSGQTGLTQKEMSLLFGLRPRDAEFLHELVVSDVGGMAASHRVPAKTRAKIAVFPATRWHSSPDGTTSHPIVQPYDSSWGMLLKQRLGFDAATSPTRAQLVARANAWIVTGALVGEIATTPASDVSVADVAMSTDVPLVTFKGSQPIFWSADASDAAAARSSLASIRRRVMLPVTILRKRLVTQARWPSLAAERKRFRSCAAVRGRKAHDALLCEPGVDLEPVSMRLPKAVAPVSDELDVPSKRASSGLLSADVQELLELGPTRVAHDTGRKRPRMIEQLADADNSLNELSAMLGLLQPPGPQSPVVDPSASQDGAIEEEHHIIDAMVKLLAAAERRAIDDYARAMQSWLQDSSRSLQRKAMPCLPASVELELPSLAAHVGIDEAALRAKLDDMASPGSALGARALHAMAAERSRQHQVMFSGPPWRSCVRMGSTPASHAPDFEPPGTGHSRRGPTPWDAFAANAFVHVPSLLWLTAAAYSASALLYRVLLGSTSAEECARDVHLVQQELLRCGDASKLLSAAVVAQHLRWITVMNPSSLLTYTSSWCKRAAKAPRLMLSTVQLPSADALRVFRSVPCFSSAMMHEHEQDLDPENELSASRLVECAKSWLTAAPAGEHASRIAAVPLMDVEWLADHAVGRHAVKCSSAMTDAPQRGVATAADTRLLVDDWKFDAVFRRPTAWEPLCDPRTITQAASAVSQLLHRLAPVRAHDTAQWFSLSGKHCVTSVAVALAELASTSAASSVVATQNAVAWMRPACEAAEHRICALVAARKVLTTGARVHYVPGSAFGDVLATEDIAACLRHSSGAVLHPWVSLVDGSFLADVAVRSSLECLRLVSKAPGLAESDVPALIPYMPPGSCRLLLRALVKLGLLKLRVFRVSPAVDAAVPLGDYDSAPPTRINGLELAGMALWMFRTTERAGDGAAWGPADEHAAALHASAHAADVTPLTAAELHAVINVCSPDPLPLPNIYSLYYAAVDVHVRAAMLFSSILSVRPLGNEHKLV